MRKIKVSKADARGRALSEAMYQMERTALGHANDWLRYSRSPQAKRDAEVDRERRAESDKAAGHLPTCSLSKCDPNCRRTGR